MTHLRIAVIGLDHWYSAVPFVRAVADRDDLDLVAVVHDDPARVAQALDGRETGAIRDTDALLADDTVDAVGVFLSPDRSASIAVAAARAGKHILSVKPMAMDLAAASEVRTAVTEAGVVFLGHESRPRYTPMQSEAHDWVRSGRFGDLVSAHSSFSAPLPAGWLDTHRPEWFIDPARTPFGAWADHGMYQIDELRWLTGAEVELVSGSVQTLRHRDLPFEDSGSATVTFRDGLNATLTDTWTAPPGAYRITSGLIGTIGALAFDSAAGRLGVYEQGSWAWSVAPDMDPNGLDGFVRAIRGEIVPRAGVDDAWRNFAACCAFYESVATGAPARPREPEDVRI